jgi:hypothetical protein
MCMGCWHSYSVLEGSMDGWKHGMMQNEHVWLVG